MTNWRNILGSTHRGDAASFEFERDPCEVPERTPNLTHNLVKGGIQLVPDLGLHPIKEIPALSILAEVVITPSLG
jgi:hypothetical protein